MKENLPPPSIEDVKSEIEQEIAVISKRKEKEALATYQKARKAYKENRFDEATKHINKSLQLFQIPSFYITLGLIQFSISDFKSAEISYKKALSLYGNQNQRGKGTLLTQLGTVYDNIGEYSKAIEHYTLALKIARAIGDRQGEGFEYYNQALKISKKTGDRKSEGTWLGNIGSCYSSLRL